MGKKQKELLKKKHPNARYIVDAGIKGKVLTSYYAVITEFGYLLYKEGLKEQYDLVKESSWENFKQGTVDHYFLKSVFDFEESTGKREQLILMEPNNQKNIQNFINSKIIGDIVVVKRKFANKIVGYRTKKKWKMIVAAFLYLFLFITIASAFNEEETALNDESINSEVNAATDEKNNNLATDNNKGNSEDKQKETEENSNDKAEEEDQVETPKENDDKAEPEDTNSNPSTPVSSTDNTSSPSNNEDEKEEPKPAPKPEEPEKETNPNLINATVTRIVDGDTIEINLNGTVESVRLLLVDTPETKHPSLPVQEFGPEASQFAKDKLSGKQVQFEYDGPERDKYDRLLGYLWIGGKTFNEMLLEEGLARLAYVYDPPYTHYDAYMKAQNRAMNAKKGIWSIPGYVTADGFNQAEPEPEPDPEPEQPETGGSYTGTYDPFGPDRDCGDFDTHQDAQDFFIAAGGPEEDPHRLDGSDGDGLACETLP